MLPSGSYARGTTLGEHSDVDLLLALNDLPSDAFWQKLPLFLSVYVVLLRSDPKQRFQDVTTTSFAVKFTFVAGAAVVDCDLLLVPASKWKMSENALRGEARSCAPWQKRYYSAVFGKFQVSQRRKVTVLVNKLKKN